MAGGGAAEIIADGELSAAGLAARAATLLTDEKLLAEMSKASAALAQPEAARQIADEVLAAANSPSGAPYPFMRGERRTGT
jgi:UDP-N-acetylglucosamine--N-acetylmuramyl-(pentapeptide) pyrophosphoryl-undecaprenol N-acetylglucosamine transferase